MNKFLVICNPKIGLFLQVHYNAEQRGKEILGFHVHNLVIDGEYSDPQILPIGDLIVGEMSLNNVDVISATYRLTPDLLQRIGRARSVGIAMKPSKDARIFMGYYGMKFADGAPKLAGLMNACSGGNASSAQSNPFAGSAPRRGPDPVK